jgi:hypothetical protein
MYLLRQQNTTGKHYFVVSKNLPSGSYLVMN